MLDLNVIGLLAAAAGCLHLIGYIAYIANDDINPNPVTWLMFSYGTLLLTVLEWDSGATSAELLLPGVCSAMALTVAGRCWWRARLKDPSRYWPREWWPSDWRDRAAFQIDIALTALYLAAASFVYFDWIGVEFKELTVLVFLLAANFTTFSAFFPLIRSVLENPAQERAGPWMIWTAAYTLLGITTAMGGVWTELMVYPVLNALLHGTVAFLSRKSRRDYYPVWPESGIRGQA